MSFSILTKEQRAQIKINADANFEARIKRFKSLTTGYYRAFFDNIPNRYKRAWLDCFEGTASKRKAIAAKCYECVGFEDTQNNVGQCQSRTCPLWNYRPLQQKKVVLKTTEI